jgi:aryl carrier-like protein
LESLPLTANLKLDRNALPAPDAPAPHTRIVAAPRNGLETQLSQICAAVLSAGEIGVHDNLFALGADSLHIFRIAQRLHDIDIAIAAKHIFEHPTIAALAAFIETNGAPERTEANPALPSLRDFRGGARRRKHGP